MIFNIISTNRFKPYDNLLHMTKIGFIHNETLDIYIGYARSCVSRTIISDTLGKKRLHKNNLSALLYKFTVTIGKIARVTT